GECQSDAFHQAPPPLLTITPGRSFALKSAEKVPAKLVPEVPAARITFPARCGAMAGTQPLHGSISNGGDLLQARICDRKVILGAAREETIETRGIKEEPVTRL